MPALRRLPWIAVAATGVTLVAAVWPFTVDDTYITLRYAQNLAGGAGPTFNAGEPPVEGYTCFLWMALLALPHLLGIPAALFAKAVGVAATAGVLVITARLARGMGASPAAATGGALWVAAFPPTAVHAVSGMETALFTLLLAGLAWLGIRFHRAPTRAGAAMVALCSLALGLTRPEGNLLAGVMLACLFAPAPGGRRHLVSAALLFYVLPGGIYFAWRHAYYGLLFPLPFYVKVASPGRLPGLPHVGEFLRYAALPLSPFLVAGAVRLPARAWPALGGAVALLAFGVFPEHIMGFEWRYLHPVTPILAAVAALGLDRLAGFAARPALRAATGAAAALVVVVLFLGNARDAVRPARAYAAGLRAAHVALGERLAPTAGEGRWLAIGDAGATPYVSGWRTIDTFGLNDPETATRGHDPERVLARAPELLVLLSKHVTTFEPILPWEGPLHAAAERHGYRLQTTYRFNDTYHLWVLERPRD